MKSITEAQKEYYDTCLYWYNLNKEAVRSIVAKHIGDKDVHWHLSINGLQDEEGLMYFVVYDRDNRADGKETLRLILDAEDEIKSLNLFPELAIMPRSKYNYDEYKDYLPEC